MNGTDSPRRAAVSRHVAHPLRLDLRGRTAMTEDERYLAGLVEHVLFTAPGERINRPDFGSGVRRLVFAPPGDALTETTQALIHGALQTWLGDLIRVETVEVTTLDSRWEVVVTYAPLSAADPEQRHTVTVTGGAP